MINFKKAVSVVVVFSLVLCSCGGSKDSGRGTKVPDPLARAVQTTYRVNDGLAMNGDIFTEGSVVNMKGAYKGCSYDAAAKELTCTSVASNSISRIDGIEYDGKFFKGEGAKCFIEGGGGGCVASPATKCVLQDGKCVSPPILVKEVKVKEVNKDAEKKRLAKEEAARQKEDEKQKKAQELKKKQEEDEKQKELADEEAAKKLTTEEEKRRTENLPTKPKTETKQDNKSRGIGVSIAIIIDKGLSKLLRCATIDEDKIVARPVISSIYEGLILLLSVGVVCVGIKLVCACCKSDKEERHDADSGRGGGGPPYGGNLLLPLGTGPSNQHHSMSFVSSIPSTQTRERPAVVPEGSVVATAVAVVVPEPDEEMDGLEAALTGTEQMLHAYNDVEAEQRAAIVALEQYELKGGPERGELVGLAMVIVATARRRVNRARRDLLQDVADALTRAEMMINDARGECKS